MSEPFTKAVGVWVDPVTKYGTRIKKSVPATVGGTVRDLTKQVIKRVNNAYSFDPPLEPKDMTVHPFTGKLYLLHFLTRTYSAITDLESDDDLHAEPDQDGLLVLVDPKRATTTRVRRRFRTIQQVEKKATKLVGLIHDSDDSEGMINYLSLYLSYELENHRSI